MPATTTSKSPSSSSNSGHSNTGSSSTGHSNTDSGHLQNTNWDHHDDNNTQVKNTHRQLTGEWAKPAWAAFVAKCPGPVKAVPTKDDSSKAPVKDDSSKAPVIDDSSSDSSSDPAALFEDRRLRRN
jgi:hypothetical protein